MQRFFRLFLLGSLLSYPLYSQDLNYYLPQDIEYDNDIPAPESILGHQVGTWHASHDKLVWYLTTLAEASERITIETYARSYEGRPLLLLTITSPQNHQNIESLQKEHLQLSDPGTSTTLDVNSMPAVVWMGYSVHGNEASGTNASLLAAYYLAAAKGPKIQELLDNTIILLDPSINPDGMNRFASWVNSHKSKILDSNPQSLEHNEAWPRGRTNHYWFDLNRDWLPLQHPESQGRVNKFHQWKPNILTDHHEMGSQRTFFFQPGEPARNHPLTPPRTFELTSAIAKYHARALDKIGSLYYSGEGYDDFYYGKGSTYPDVNGGIGILFEQASARGHLQETKNGLLSFPFAIRNQFTTTLSTLEAAVELRQELLNHQREFYRNALQQASADDIKAYVFGERDLARVYHFLDLLSRHQIKTYQTSREIRASGTTFNSQNSFIVPLNQSQYRLIKAIFEQRTSFQDSLFYDVSAWTLPLAFNLEFAALDRKAFATSLLGAEVTDTKLPEGHISGTKSDYGYLFSWHHYYAPRSLAKILRHGLRASVATESMVGDFGNFKPGTVIIPVANQNKPSDEIHALLEAIAKEDGVDITPLGTGFSATERSWGSPSIEALHNPKILVVSDGDISGYEVGEVWHLLDHRFDIPMTLVAQDKIGGVELSKYNTVVLVNGEYKTINKTGTEKLKSWVNAGGVVIAWKKGAKWLADQSISTVNFEKEYSDTLSHLAYGDRNRHSGAQVIGGAIFETEADLSHPLLFGYQHSKIPVFRNHSLFMKKSNNPFTNPLMYTDRPLLSGYISSNKLEELADTPALEVSHVGKGKIISLADNPNFRAFWLGTNKLFLNALFFGHFLDPESIK